MNTSFLTVIIGLLLTIVGVLVFGLISMARGGAFARRYGNKLMRTRIVLQLLAVFLLVVAAWLKSR